MKVSQSTTAKQVCFSKSRNINSGRTSPAVLFLRRSPTDPLREFCLSKVNHRWVAVVGGFAHLFRCDRCHRSVLGVYFESQGGGWCCAPCRGSIGAKNHAKNGTAGHSSPDPGQHGSREGAAARR